MTDRSLADAMQLNPAETAELRAQAERLAGHDQTDTEQETRDE